MFEHLRVFESEFLTVIRKKCVACLNTKEISRLAAHLDGKGLLLKNKLVFPQSLVGRIEEFKSPSVWGTAENKARATSPRYTLRTYIGSQLTKPFHLHLHERHLCHDGPAMTPEGDHGDPQHF